MDLNDGVDRGNPQALEVRNLGVQYAVGRRVRGMPRESVYALDSLTTGFERGISTAVVGESGCGKTTLARSLVGLTPTTAGSQILLKGSDVLSMPSSERRNALRDIQLLFQSPYSSFDPRQRLRYSLLEPLFALGRSERKDSQARVFELVNRVGLSGSILDKYPHQLSGGQLQRLAIARLLVARPHLLILDEPLSALDVSLQAQVVSLLADLRAEFNLTYIFITHDLALLRQIASTVCVLYLGRLVEKAAVSDFLSTPMHPYSSALLSAIPIPDPVRERRRNRIVLQGDPPSPVNTPRGCRFHPRCWLRQKLGEPDVCVDVDPQLYEVSDSVEHYAACHFSSEMRGDELYRE